jgi:hypothetical protein
MEGVGRKSRVRNLVFLVDAYVMSTDTGCVYHRQDCQPGSIVKALTEPLLRQQCVFVLHDVSREILTIYFTVIWSTISI